MTVLKFVNHSNKVQVIAARSGWLHGARYTNIRDVKRLNRIDFIDIDWKNYDFERHLHCVRNTNPIVTVAQDVVDCNHTDEILKQADTLSRFAKFVIIVPKDVRIADTMETDIPKKYIFGYSVPTKYGGTEIDTKYFKRRVHLLGGRPDTQRRLARSMNVFSIDCNRFTLDASFGDYFNGSHFVPHPAGGYEKCIADSINNINYIWENYAAYS